MSIVYGTAHIVASHKAAKGVVCPGEGSGLIKTRRVGKGGEHDGELAHWSVVWLPCVALP